MMFRRSRFAPLVDQQLDLFASQNGDLLARIAASLDEYNRAERDEAEELFGEYMDAHAVAAEILEEMRDTYALTVEDSGAYVDAFNRAVRKRWPVTATELD